MYLFWVGFVTEPYVDYAILLVTALLLPGNSEGPVFAIGGAMLPLALTIQERVATFCRHTSGIRYQTSLLAVALQSRYDSARRTISGQTQSPLRSRLPSPARPL